MFIVALFNSQIWKQLKCPSTDEWVKIIHIYICMYVVECVYIYTHIYLYTHIHIYTYILYIYIYIVEYYSAIKNEILPFVTTWMNLESIILSEISQTEKDKHCMISRICEI